LKPRLRVLAQPTQTDNTRTHRLLTVYSQNTHRLLTDYSPTEMKTVQVTLTLEYALQDLMRDPQMRKALQEREQAYLENLTWLDEDLDKKMEKRHQENLIWLDEDLDKKMEKRHQENLTWLDEDLDKKMAERQKSLLREIESSQLTQAQEQRTPKIWHCGHGAKWGRTDSKLEKEIMMLRHSTGIREGTCFIHTGHLNDESLRTRGNNTTKQFKKFLDGSQEGDIVFTSCSKKGGLTHYGFFTGEITQDEVQDEEDKLNNRTSIHNFIHVYEWFPLSQILKGAGRNSTLYEVKPTFKNYQNYSIQF